MKKIIILLTLPFVLLMADLTLNGTQLTPISEQVNNENVNSNVTRSNDYLEVVDIPVYDRDNPTHVLITPTNGKWNESILNNLNYKHFYITAGTYSNTVMQLKSSGSDTDRRTLSLYDPNNPTDATHPGALPISKQADLRLGFFGAHYWIVDRVSTISTSEVTAIDIKGASTHNIINRVYIKNYNKYAIVFDTLCHNNTIQNSRIADQSLAGRKGDGCGIFFVNYANWKGETYTYNTKIIKNEIVNASDGIQLIRRWSDWENRVPVTTGYDGTIIDSNQIYITPSIYTDGNGNITPSGTHSYSENAIDLKAGSYDVNNKVIITNNYIWGYRPADSTRSNLSDQGTAIAIHYEVKNTVIEDNVIFDSTLGIVAGDAHGLEFGLGYSSISNNILWDIKETALTIWASQHVDMVSNIIEGANHWMNTTALTNSNITDTVLVNCSPGSIQGSYGNGVIETNTTTAAASEIDHTKFTFTMDNYTSTPISVNIGN